MYIWKYVQNKNLWKTVFSVLDWESSTQKNWFFSMLLNLHVQSFLSLFSTVKNHSEHFFNYTKHNFISDIHRYDFHFSLQKELLKINVSSSHSMLFEHSKILFWCDLYTHIKTVYRWNPWVWHFFHVREDCINWVPSCICQAVVSIYTHFRTQLINCHLMKTKPSS
jgi:hypothetical protein